MAVQSCVSLTQVTVDIERKYIRVILIDILDKHLNIAGHETHKFLHDIFHKKQNNVHKYHLITFNTFLLSIRGTQNTQPSANTKPYKKIKKTQSSIQPCGQQIRKFAMKLSKDLLKQQSFLLILMPCEKEIKTLLCKYGWKRRQFLLWEG